MTYIIAAVVVLVFCAIGLSIGVLLRGRPMRTCGNAARDEHGNSMGCSFCGGRGGGECKKDEAK